jgi:hypothetical protein
MLDACVSSMFGTYVRHWATYVKQLDSLCNLKYVISKIAKEKDLLHSIGLICIN